MKKRDEIIDVKEEIDASLVDFTYMTHYYLVKTKKGHYYSVVRTSDGRRYQERVYLGSENNSENLIANIIGIEKETAGMFWRDFIEQFVPASSHVKKT